MSYHYKKDGSLDMRYASSREAVSSGFSSFSSPYTSSYSGDFSSNDLHYKRDGSLDMRYSSSKATVSPNSHSNSSYASSGHVASDLHYTKDGSLDMRYSSSKAAVSPNSYSASSYASSGHAASDLHYTKDGSLDMRYTSSKAAVSPNSHSNSSYASSGHVASDLHYTKDGSLNTSLYEVAVSPNSYNDNSSYANSGHAPSDLHYKKDGSLDMRYSSSKAAVSPNSNNASSGYKSSSHTSDKLDCKDSGSVGMDDKKLPRAAISPAENKLHLKKDGTPDMRYKTSQEMAIYMKGLSVKDDITSGIPLTKAGYPDMRSKIAREWVAKQAVNNVDIPLWVPRRKDGTVDPLKAVGKAFLDACNVHVPQANLRATYYKNILQNHVFMDQVRKCRNDTVLIPQQETLPNTQELKYQLALTLHKDSVEASNLKYSLESVIPNSVPAIDYAELKKSFEDEEKSLLGRGAFGIVLKGIWQTKGPVRTPKNVEAVRAYIQQSPRCEVFPHKPWHWGHSVRV